MQSKDYLRHLKCPKIHLRYFKTLEDLREKMLPLIIGYEAYQLYTLFGERQHLVTLNSIR